MIKVIWLVSLDLSWSYMERNQATIKSGKRKYATLAFWGSLLQYATYATNICRWPDFVMFTDHWPVVLRLIFSFIKKLRKRILVWYTKKPIANHSHPWSVHVLPNYWINSRHFILFTKGSSNAINTRQENDLLFSFYLLNYTWLFICCKTIFVMIWTSICTVQSIEQCFWYIP